MRMRPLAVISQEEIDERLREKAEKRVPHMDYEMPESVNLSFLRRSIIYHLIRGEIDQLGSTVETLARHFKEDELVTVYNAMFAVSRGDYETSQSLINGIDLLQDSDVSWLAAETVRLLYLHGGVEEDYVVQFLADLGERREDVFDSFAEDLKEKIHSQIFTNSPVERRDLEFFSAFGAEDCHFKGDMSYYLANQGRDAEAMRLLNDFDKLEDSRIALICLYAFEMLMHRSPKYYNPGKSFCTKCACAFPNSPEVIEKVIEMCPEAIPRKSNLARKHYEIR